MGNKCILAAICFRDTYAGGGAEGLDVDPLAAVIVNAVITNVGGAGYYDDVVDMIGGEKMQCPSFDDACVKEVGGAV